MLESRRLFLSLLIRHELWAITVAKAKGGAPQLGVLLLEDLFEAEYILFLSLVHIGNLFWFHLSDRQLRLLLLLLFRVRLGLAAADLGDGLLDVPKSLLKFGYVAAARLCARLFVRCTRQSRLELFLKLNLLVAHF